MEVEHVVRQGCGSGSITRSTPCHSNDGFERVGIGLKNVMLDIDPFVLAANSDSHCQYR